MRLDGTIVVGVPTEEQGGPSAGTGLWDRAPGQGWRKHPGAGVRAGSGLGPAEWPARLPGGTEGHWGPPQDGGQCGGAQRRLEVGRDSWRLEYRPARSLLCVGVGRSRWWLPGNLGSRRQLGEGVLTGGAPTHKGSVSMVMKSAQVDLSRQFPPSGNTALPPFLRPPSSPCPSPTLLPPSSSSFLPSLPPPSSSSLPLSPFSLPLSHPLLASSPRKCCSEGRALGNVPLGFADLGGSGPLTT